MILNLDFNSDIPIYTQIREQIINLAGEIPAKFQRKDNIECLILMIKM